MKNNEKLKRKKSDYLLELAIEEQLEHDDEMNSYNDMGHAHVFSEEHNKKMQELFKKAEKMERRPRDMKKFRQLVAAVVVVCCLSTVTVMQVDAFRLPFLQFFSEIKDKSILFGVRKENDYNVTEDFAEYEPKYIPKGFNIANVEEDIESGSFYINYIDDENMQTYSFYFFYATDNKAIDSEDSSVNATTIAGNKAYVIQKNDTVRILMYKDNHQYYLQGSISLDDAYKIMESIR